MIVIPMKEKYEATIENSRRVTRHWLCSYAMVALRNSVKSLRLSQTYRRDLGYRIWPLETRCKGLFKQDTNGRSKWGLVKSFQKKYGSSCSASSGSNPLLLIRYVNVYTSLSVIWGTKSVTSVFATSFFSIRYDISKRDGSIVRQTTNHISRKWELTMQNCLLILWTQKNMIYCS